MRWFCYFRGLYNKVPWESWTLLQVHMRAGRGGGFTGVETPPIGFLDFFFIWFFFALVCQRDQSCKIIPIPLPLVWKLDTLFLRREKCWGSPPPPPSNRWVTLSGLVWHHSLHPILRHPCLKNIVYATALLLKKLDHYKKLFSGWTKLAEMHATLHFLIGNLSKLLKASFNNVFTLKNVSYMSLHAISVFDKV